MRTHCERSPRKVLTTTWPSIRSAASGRRERRPLRRPVVSRTISPPGTTRGEPHPARTSGSTTRLIKRKNCASTDAGAPMAATLRSLLDAGEEHADALRIGADVALPVARLGAHVDDALAVGV